MTYTIYALNNVNISRNRDIIWNNFPTTVLKIL